MPRRGTKHWFIEAFIRVKRATNKSLLHIISQKVSGSRVSRQAMKPPEWIPQIHFVSSHRKARTTKRQKLNRDQSGIRQKLHVPPNPSPSRLAGYSYSEDYFSKPIIRDPAKRDGYRKGFQQRRQWGVILILFRLSEGWRLVPFLHPLSCVLSRPLFSWNALRAPNLVSHTAGLPARSPFKASEQDFYDNRLQDPDRLAWAKGILEAIVPKVTEARPSG